VVRAAALAAAVGFLALAAAELAYPRRLRVAGMLIVRDPSVWRPSLTAIALGLIAGRGRWIARVAVPLILLTFLPVAWYRTALTRVTTERHPLRTSRDCIQSIREKERAAGRAVPGMFVYLPSGFYLHNYFYYYRHLGWDVHEALPDAELLRMLDTPGEQRPVLMPTELFAAVRMAHDTPGTLRPLVPLATVVVLLPGPYAECGR
jgi:4-amino-4-deoxy-L-arabinose transferase-like glycosyltransferase